MSRVVGKQTVFLIRGSTSVPVVFNIFDGTQPSTDKAFLKKEALNVMAHLRSLPLKPPYDDIDCKFDIVYF